MKLNQQVLDNFMSYALVCSVFLIGAGAYLYATQAPAVETLAVVCIGAGVCGIVSLLGTIAILILAHSLGEARRSNEAASKLYKGME
jgi:hypothetical protein